MRADEEEPAFAAFAGPLQVFGDDPLQGNLVPQAKQQLAGEVLGHGKDLSKQEGGQAAVSGKLEFAERLLEDRLVDAGGFLGGGRKEACRGQVVDLPRHAAGVVVDQALGYRIKELLTAAGLLELEVDVGGGLFLGKRGQVESHRDAVQQRRVQRLPQRLP